MLFIIRKYKMKNLLLAPSILSANFACLGEDIKSVINAGADILHFDVMDNHYVPNLTMGPMILKSLINYGINIPIDVHLMAKPVDNLIIEFANSGATYITFHIEASEHIERSIQLIKSFGCKAGIAFNPATPLNCLEYLIDELDLILLMSVNPGFSCQNFLTSTLKKIKQTKNIIDLSSKPIYLSVDGGIKLNNIDVIADHGANMFVIGSEIFNKKNYFEIINNIKLKLLT